MKKLAGILSLMISYSLFSAVLATEVTVQDLNQGSCWVNEGDQVKVADFNSGKAYILEQHLVQALVSKYSGGERPETLDSMVHCSGGGVAVVMNFKVDEKSFCVWTKPAQDQLEIVSVGRSLDDAGPCDGISLGKVSLKQLGQVDTAVVRNFLESKVSEGKVSAYSLSGKWWNITGSHSFEFKEENLRDDLMKSGYFESFEFDHLRHHQGEFLKINDLSL